MNIVNCKNGHFFDGEKYSVCPHCGEAVNNGGVLEQTVDRPDTNGGFSKNSFFGRKKDNSNAKIKSLSDKVQGKTLGIFGDKKESVQDDYATPKLDYRTMGKIPEGIRSSAKRENSIKEGAREEYDSKSVINHEGVNEVFSEKVIEEQRTDAFEAQSTQIYQEMEKTEKKQESLRDQINRVSSSSGGKTVGFFSTGKDESDDDEEIVEPVVGWLVCVKGKHFGEAFNIVAGRNSIGRLEGNTIVIRKDNSVSKEKHLWIMYDPKKRDFYVQPGEGSGLSYVEDDIVTETRKLLPYNKIEIGNGLYIIVPLCGERFTWEDYMK